MIFLIWIDGWKFLRQQASDDDVLHTSIARSVLYHINFCILIRSGGLHTQAAHATTSHAPPHSRHSRPHHLRSPPASPADSKSEESKTSNLVGKINNLVSTDLGNITEGRDFLFVVMYAPLQIIFAGHGQ